MSVLPLLCLAVLACTKPAPPGAAAAPSPFLGSWKAEDGTQLWVTETALYVFDDTRWRARVPVLQWTDTGPRTCYRGLPAPALLAQADNGLLWAGGKQPVLLTRHAASGLAERTQPRVLLAPPPPVSSEVSRALAAELSRRAAADQAARTGPKERLAEVDADNRVWLEETLATVGWPDPARFGLQATKDAWLLVQHLGGIDLLTSVAQQIEGIEGLEEEWALLVDRVAVFRNEPQRFGHQARALPAGGIALLPVTSPAQVNAAREALGLVPWPIYLGYFEAGGELPVLDCTTDPTQTVPATPPG